MSAIASSHLSPIRAIREQLPRSESLRIFNRMSRSELSLYISKYGVSSLPRLTNHGSRIRAAMAWLPCDEPQQLADAVARFQKEFDRMKREQSKANWSKAEVAA